MKYTILGAGGSIGIPLAKILLENNQQVRLASRSGYSMPGAESVKADVNSLSDTINAVEGSDIVYLTLGLQYDLKVWRESWPKIMSNVIEACKITGAKLIFFDNVYMYGLVKGIMTEETPYNPFSKKGEVRAEIARMLEKEFNKGDLTASIARAADLYGPYADRNSVPYIMVLSKLLKSKKPQWLVNADTIHTYSYTLDSARALYLLANDDNSFNQIWHMPTYNPGITGKEFISLCSKEFGVEPGFSVLKKWMIHLAGFFSNVIEESTEMLYQMEYDYNFDSTKFEKYFNYQPVSYAEGIKQTIAFYRK